MSAKLVGFLGPFGTYTHQAAYERFKDTVVYCEKPTIADAIGSLDSLDYAVVPRENSIYGSVIETFDNLRFLETGFIQGEIVLKIQHCLIVKEGAKLTDIDHVLSHEQALGQCRKFLAKKLPSVAISKTTSTAAAADAVSRSKTSNVAAICSKICTNIFESLEVLEEGIQDEDLNYTRFFLLARDSGNKPPAYPMCPTHALIRVTPTTEQTTVDFTALLKTLDLSVIRIDRRPSLSSIPFHDTYFLELKSDWIEEIEESLSRVRDAGFLAVNIGLW
ncbi:hypothetical protein GYMLUDRAFT_185503 [Collybiopsis luxurians FD-317 M1]|nr:hypothetical protein GYMLUDRAFT_185503 [Collybiopsis luxurians FD-317 M1]